MYNKPNFLIVGASRSGTTSLAKYLNAHPDIYIPKQKELRYFVKDTINRTSMWDPLKKHIISQSKLNEKEYFSLMNNDNSKLVGESSIHYLNHPEVSIPSIHKHVGDIPIIIMLRNPVERLISNWKYMLYDLYNLEKTIEMEDIRKKYNYNSFWFYKEQGMYYKKVKAFKESFKNVKIFIFEDFFQDINKSVSDCLNFLNVNLNKNIDYKKSLEYDKRGINSPKIRFKNRILCLKKESIFNKIRSPLLYYIFSHLMVKSINFSSKLNINLFFLKEKQVTDKYMLELYDLFEDDISNLEALLSKDLSKWKNKK